MKIRNSLPALATALSLSISNPISATAQDTTGSIANIIEVPTDTLQDESSMRIIWWGIITFVPGNDTSIDSNEYPDMPSVQVLEVSDDFPSVQEIWYRETTFPSVDTF